MLLDLDGAWEAGTCGLARVDALALGPRLRQVASRAAVDEFRRVVAPRLDAFTLYGSGDFHHLSAVLLERVADPELAVVCFDNHPDWDVRPPYWSCGGWASRVARAGRVARVSVWGCGNFELRFPHRVFADGRSLRRGALDVHAWAERQPEDVRRRFPCIDADTWRETFVSFARGLAGSRVYVSVDLDCLRAEEAVTNWESGLFSADDVAWAIALLRGECEVVGGDVCGAWSPPRYATVLQRVADRWDHPKVAAPDAERARRTNAASLAPIWSALAA